MQLQGGPEEALSLVLWPRLICPRFTQSCVAAAPPPWQDSVIERCGQQKAEGARGSQHRADTRDQSAAAWMLP